MEKKFTKVKDSGKRQAFSTGSQRDTAEGKGTPHLFPGEALNIVLNYRGDSRHLGEKVILQDIHYIMNDFTSLVESKEDSYKMIVNIASLTFDLIEVREGSYSAPFRRLAVHYQNGAKKYLPNNWRKGQPISRYFDSAYRHLLAILDKKEDEDHEAALLWNLTAIIQTRKDIERGILPEELNDYPFTLESVFGKQKEEKPSEPAESGYLKWKKENL